MLAPPQPRPARQDRDHGGGQQRPGYRALITGGVQQDAGDAGGDRARVGQVPAQRADRCGNAAGRQLPGSPRRGCGVSQQVLLAGAAVLVRVAAGQVISRPAGSCQGPAIAGGGQLRRVTRAEKVLGG